jgi:hypothetical protein
LIEPIRSKGNGGATPGSDRRRRVWIVHPFLLAIYPVIALLGANVQEISPGQTLRSFAVVLVGAAALWVILRALLRDGRKAALLTSFLLLLFFSYGQVYGALRTAPFGGLYVARHRYLIPIFAALSVAGTWLIVTRRGDLANATRVFNLMAAVAVIMAAVPIVTTVARGKGNWQVDNFQPEGGQTALGSSAGTVRPDVYYIILDAYGRSDFLQEKFGYDNSNFIDFLHSRGFYIATQGNTNHIWTALSLASSLNMDFDQNLGVNLATGAYPSAMVEPIQHSLVRANFEKLGYKIVGFSSGYSPTEITDADYYFSPDIDRIEPPPPGLTLNAFEGMLFHASAGRIIEDFTDPATRNRIGFRTNYPFSVLRTIIEYDFEQLKAVPDIPEPTFTFVHIVAPHSPYLFGPNGEPVEQTGVFSLTIEGVTQSDSENELYKNQAIYISHRAEEVVQAILDKSDTPPIIIIQADHGPSAGWSGEIDNPDLAMRTAILNAYHLPPGCERMLYPTISPVNSFRVVFDCVFGATYPMLPDNAYFSNWPRQAAYGFNLVNDRTRPPIQTP